MVEKCLQRMVVEVVEHMGYCSRHRYRRTGGLAMDTIVDEFPGPRTEIGWEYAWVVPTALHCPSKLLVVMKYKDNGSILRINARDERHLSAKIGGLELREQKMTIRPPEGLR